MNAGVGDHPVGGAVIPARVWLALVAFGGVLAAVWEAWP